MKKGFVWLMVVCLLIGLTACGEEKSIVTDYGTGVEGARVAIEAGDHVKAYRLLQSASGAEAEEMLKKFVFVPSSWTFEEDGELVEKKQYTYDAVGRLQSVLRDDPSREKTTTTTFVYDAQGYLAQSKEVSSSGENETENFSCSNGGRQIVSENGVVYLCDETGRVIKETSENSVIAYAYDEAGRLLSMESDYSKSTYSYDEQGRRIGRTNVRDGQSSNRTYGYLEEEGKTAVYNTEDPEDKDYLSWDQYGNLLTWQSSNETYTYTWTVFYYPEGIPFATFMEMNEVTDIKYP